MQKSILVRIRSWSADGDASDELYRLPHQHCQTLDRLLKAGKCKKARVLVKHHGVSVTPDLTIEATCF